MTQIKILFLVFLFFSSCQVTRYVVYNFADVKDYKRFPSRSIEASENPFYFSRIPNINLGKRVYNEKEVSFETYLEKNQTAAFLVIRNDTIIYENYFNSFQEASIVPSFSMAKSITSLLIGCAIEEGWINSVDDPITNYIPELEKNGLGKVTIEHVLNMTTGLDIDESYINPFGHAASIYYGRKLRKQVLKYKLKAEPGTKFEYTSGTSQLLGFILERALKGKYTITSYFYEKLWEPLGMEYDASWSIDKKKNGMEKTFCCINARARDFAKLGRLMLNKGNWNGEQVVPSAWIESSTQIISQEGSTDYYQYQWWIYPKSNSYMAQGILGQYIYVNPDRNIVIVRLGKKTGKINWWHFFENFVDLYQL